jgi:hypothetical protein
MKSATSIYLGGEIVSASDCDFNSYKELGLLCPFCKEPVHLRSQHERMIKDEKHLVQQAFIHYHNPEINSYNCELRSQSSEGKEQIQKIQLAIRNQRLELYNRHLWEMLVDGTKFTKERMREIDKLFGKKLLSSLTKEARIYWRSIYFGATYLKIDILIDKIINMQDSEVAELVGLRFEEMTCKQINYFRTKVNVMLHKEICQEVCSFLITDQSSYAWEKLLKAAIYFIDYNVYYQSGQSMFNLKLERIKEYFTPEQIVNVIPGIIIGTHWIDLISDRLKKYDRR